MAAMFAKGDEVNMAKALVDFWNTLKADDVYKSWGLGILEGVFKKGLYNNDVFRNTLETLYPETAAELKRRIALTITNYDTGEPEVYDESSSREELLDVMMASSSAPSVFPF